jgi:propanol-preferring alcohol dehydrogenase
MTLLLDGVADHIAGPVMCSASTMYSLLKESELTPADGAVFPGGGGGVGIQSIQLAVDIGLRPVVINTGAEETNLALEHNAEAYVDFRSRE